MFIKIERKDKTEMHHAKSYYSNHLKNGLDFNVERIDGNVSRHHFENGEEINVFIMNNDGKTIDRI